MLSIPACVYTLTVTITITYFTLNLQTKPKQEAEILNKRVLFDCHCYSFSPKFCILLIPPVCAKWQPIMLYNEQLRWRMSQFKFEQ